MATNRQFRIDSVPEKDDTSMHTTQGVPREEANVEAERGETMVTSDGISNQKKIVAIGGKPHSEGGTPLDVEDGTVIYSDKLKIKDPLVLKFFNESGKKAKTFADLSKKYDITKWQKELENPDNDNITNTSLEKNLDDGNFKLSALFAIQEFHEEKGSPEEHSKQFEPFMERMGISYEQLFGTEGQGGQDAEPLLARKGGTVSFDSLPELHSGGTIPEHSHKNGEHVSGTGDDYTYEERYQQAGFDRLNRMRELSGLEAISGDLLGNKQEMDAAAGEMQQAFNNSPNLLKDYYLNTDNDPEKSDRPNTKMQEALLALGKKPANGTDFTNAEMSTFFESGDIDMNWLKSNANDNLWTYRAAYSDVKDVTQEEYDALKTQLDADGIAGADGNVYLWKGGDLYEAYRVNPDGTIEQVEPDPKVIDGSYEWDLNRNIDATPKERNMDYRWDHKRATAQARKNKTKIPRLSPFTPIEETSYADQIYYSPDQAIASMQSMVSDAGTKQAMFAPQQQQVGNFLAGQQFDMMAKIIGQYEDKNVAAYNRESLTNTNIANRASQRLSRAIEGHHDKTTVLKQEFQNARTNADNNIAENEIAMWNERRNRMNLEATIGEQFATDPNTGLHEFQVGKDFAPDNTSTTDIGDVFADLKNKLPGVEDKVIADMAAKMMSGKYDVTRDGTPPNPDNYR